YGTEAVTGGDGTDTLKLASSVTGNVTLGTSITNIETVDLSAITDTVTGVNLTGFTSATTYDLGDTFAGAATVTGGAGNDTFTVGTLSEDGTVSLAGGDGNDTFTVGAVTDALTINGGAGTNTLELASSVTGNVTLGTSITNIETVDLSATTGVNLTGFTSSATTYDLGDTFAGVATVTGGSAADTFEVKTTDTGAVSLNGDGGGDTYKLQVNGYNKVTITGTAGSKDTVDFFGVTATTADLTNVNGSGVYASTDSSGNLLLSFDSAGSSFLAFASVSGNDDEDTMNFKNADGSVQLAGVDLKDVADLTLQNGTWTQLKFTVTGGTTTYSGVTAA
ncbi:hypothetical protein, partial [Desulfovibrio legallii]